MNSRLEWYINKTSFQWRNGGLETVVHAIDNSDTDANELRANAQYSIGYLVLFDFVIFIILIYASSSIMIW